MENVAAGHGERGESSIRNRCFESRDRGRRGRQAPPPDLYTQRSACSDQRSENGNRRNCRFGQRKAVSHLATADLQGGSIEFDFNRLGTHADRLLTRNTERDFHVAVEQEFPTDDR